MPVFDSKLSKTGSGKLDADDRELIELIEQLSEQDTKFDWKHSARTEKVDTEHRKLIELIKRLGEPDVQIKHLLENLHVGFAKHFAYEEAVMRAYSYDGYDEHQADHQRILNEITTAMSLRDQTQIDGPALARRLYESFCNHLVMYDDALGQAG